MMPSSCPTPVRTETFTKTNTDELIHPRYSLDYRVLNFATSTFDDNNTSYWHKSVGGYHPAKLRRYQEMIEHHISPEMQAAYKAIATAGGEMDSVDANKFRILEHAEHQILHLPCRAAKTNRSHPQPARLRQCMVCKQGAVCEQRQRRD